jgi:hypothetical protein
MASHFDGESVGISVDDDKLRPGTKAVETPPEDGAAKLLRY